MFDSTAVGCSVVVTMMNSTMNSDCVSLEEGDLQIELSNSSGFKDGPSPHIDDELMFTLDTLEEHANGSMQALQATRDSELYWVAAIRERDELINSKEKSIEHLQSLNEKLRSENDYLVDQLLQLNGEATEGEKSQDGDEQVCYHLSILQHMVDYFI